MRKTVLLLLLALLVPAAAQSQSSTPQNGTLSIREGRGIVQLDARGSMTGRLNGKISITDPKPYDKKRPVVYGSGDPTANVFYDGTWSLNDSPPLSLPDTATPFELAPPPGPQ